jgi:hypothetical protein
MRKSGFVRGLRELALGTGGEPPECVTSAKALLQRLLLAPLAVCMGQHQRVGSNSLFFRLDEYVTALIIDLSFDSVSSLDGNAPDGRLNYGAECAAQGVHHDGGDDQWLQDYGNMYQQYDAQEHQDAQET